MGQARLKETGGKRQKKGLQSLDSRPINVDRSLVAGYMRLYVLRMYVHSEVLRRMPALRIRTYSHIGCSAVSSWFRTKCSVRRHGPVMYL